MQFCRATHVGLAHSVVFAIGRCSSVCLSVHHTLVWCCVETAERIITKRTPSAVGL